MAERLHSTKEGLHSTEETRVHISHPTVTGSNLGLEILRPPHKKISSGWMWFQWNNSQEAQNRKISLVHSLLINKFAKWRISIQNNNPESQFFLFKSRIHCIFETAALIFSDAEVSSLNVFVGSSTWVSVIVVGGNPAWLLAFATVEKWRENVRLSGQMKSFKVESWGSTFESRHSGNSKRNPTFKPELLNSHFSSDSVTRKNSL